MMLSLLMVANRRWHRTSGGFLPSLLSGGGKPPPSCMYRTHTKATSSKGRITDQMTVRLVEEAAPAVPQRASDTRTLTLIGESKRLHGCSLPWPSCLPDQRLHSDFTPLGLRSQYPARTVRKNYLRSRLSAACEDVLSHPNLASNSLPVAKLHRRDVVDGPT
ncbi:hypothetical protein BDM02DRAFT_287074 [Thelephora ganbajun]|uniref:Uncharacterized protein n=1 Tax=Thelephora ganbajun TaxID=370292 RepID=A0ACB6ZAK8_THEGA|nr:hypothetical protein BDM02DRAFT_287074 [Thelephora ganbajun]